MAYIKKTYKVDELDSGSLLTIYEGRKTVSELAFSDTSSLFTYLSTLAQINSQLQSDQDSDQDVVEG